MARKPLSARCLSRISNVVYAYQLVKERVLQAGYEAEIEWQASIVFEKITEATFLREAAWVVLSSGMRESVIRKCFPSFSSGFFDWSSATVIAANQEVCRRRAMKVFSHSLKVDAIIAIAKRVAKEDFINIYHQIRTQGIDFLQTFPFIGPVTSWHLAKNIGMDVAKADRHLIRIAKATDYSSPLEMCRDIASIANDSVAVVDLVIWRYATLDRNYVSLFTDPFAAIQTRRAA